MEEEGVFLNLFYEASITLTPKPDKEHLKREDYKPVSLMNIDTKMLNKISVNGIQQNMERHIP